MPPKNIICTECESVSEQKTAYCAECGAEYPWKKEPKYEFEEEDLPLLFSYPIESRDWNIWDEFCKDYFGEENIDARDIESFPRNFPKMESFEEELYFVITESLELKGPYIQEPQMFTGHGHTVIIDD